ncbi:MAG: crossover junction endodeoxyribonuclease RuvC [Actinobacteria bacterium]|nr:crossover junction endodeoxyribonuclease RuvC [Actinomycetota bacterium]
MPDIVLGIDPGLTRCGYGVIVKSSSRQVAFQRVGVFESSSKDELSLRIEKIGTAISKLLAEVKPDSVAIERVFSQQNLHSVMSVAQISGVIVYLCKKKGIPVTFYTPTEVKAAVTGSGRASKDQVTTMVTKILHLKEIPKPADAADALAIAITAAWRGSGSQQVTETASQRKWRDAEAASKQKQR